MTSAPILLSSPDANVAIRWVGRVEYTDALAQQEKLVEERTRGAGDSVLLLEHEPVYTIGRTPDRSSLRDPAHLPHPVVVINRGGQATYHGPGQLVGYPILDLRVRGQDLHVYLRALEELIITVARHYSIDAIRRDGLTGVWVGTSKLASIGVGVRRWISMHGFALNVARDLSGFEHITPCGISGVEMTSLSREAGREIDIREVAEVVAREFPAIDAQLRGTASST